MCCICEQELDCPSYVDLLNLGSKTFRAFPPNSINYNSITAIIGNAISLDYSTCTILKI